MANIFPALTRVHPSFMEPELILTYAQASAAFSALSKGKPDVKIGAGDLFVYIRSLNLQTQTQANQAAPNYLPSATLVADYYSTATYLLRVRADYDRHDMAAAANWNVALPAAQDLGMKQGIYQAMRSGLLYGYNPSNNEGLLNAVGATKVSLPDDSQGNDALMTYDAGELALFFLTQISNLLNRVYTTGKKKLQLVFVGPQRILRTMQFADIVELVSYQRTGAGTATVGQEIAKVAEENDVDVLYGYDDTLIGQGAGGWDAVIMTLREVEEPHIQNPDTDVFAGLQPNMRAVNLMYADSAAPIKIPTPIPDGGITEVQELRTTSGWNIRPQAMSIISINYQ